MSASAGSVPVIRAICHELASATADPDGTATLHVADVTLTAVDPAAIEPPSARPAEADEERIDLDDALVVPGAFDGHVHFDDPGFTHRENFETGTLAAAAGGVTCVVDMPCTSLPPITDAEALAAKVAAAKTTFEAVLNMSADTDAAKAQHLAAHLKTT